MLYGSIRKASKTITRKPIGTRLYTTAIGIHNGGEHRNLRVVTFLSKQTWILRSHDAQLSNEQDDYENGYDEGIEIEEEEEEDDDDDDEDSET